MKEEQFDIKGYEGLYKISNLGNIKNRHNRYLKPFYNEYGYQRINLCKNSMKKTQYVHRLVAISFIPNPDNLPQVNHKDESRDNNYYQNLEWCDSEYNNNYGNHINKLSDALSLPIVGISSSGESFYYRSTRAAEIIIGSYSGNITAVLKGRLKTTKGFTFKYLTDQEIEQHKDELLPKLEDK